MNEEIISAILVELREIKQYLRQDALNKEGAIKPITKELLTIREACEFIGVSVPMMHYYTRPNNILIPFVKLGNRKRFRLDDLQNWCRLNIAPTAKQARQEYIDKQIQRRNGK